MSNPKFKVENYQNLGGINSKFSPHLTSPLEFLDIVNYDFQTPGALTQRWGSTQYMSQTLVGKITALSEYQKLDGTSMLIVGSTGGLWFGATTGQFQGMSFSIINSTQVIFGVTNTQTGNYITQGKYITGTTTAYLVYGQNQGIFYQGSSNQYIMNYGNEDYPFYPPKFTIPSQNIGSNYGSIVYLVDRAFIANGKSFVKFDGVTTTPVGLPFPMVFEYTSNYTETANTSLIGFGYTGAAIFYFSYVNNRGFESNIFPLVSVEGPCNGPSFSSGAPNGLLAITLTLTSPIGYGISTINIYSYCVQYPDNQGHPWNSDPGTWNLPYTKLASYPVSGSTLTTIAVGTTRGNMSKIFNNGGVFPNPFSNQYQPLGLTLGDITTSTYVPNVTGTVSYQVNGYSKPYITSFYPQFLSVYDNRLFCAGFSSSPSTVWFSDVKEPEGFLPANNFEVRTNDSDYITAMSAYQTRLYIFKKNSFHVLFGDSPNNFFVQEISNLYGCLNNRCAVLFDDVMVFLDRKGIFQYNGANLTYLSTKIQPIFDRMNYNVALTEACGAHDKLRNQVLFSIPIDGSSTNNITIVYDYVANAWTTHKGYNPSIFAEIQGYNSIRRLFYGGYSGSVNWFSASFLSDNGAGISLSYKTRFLHDMGDSVQKQFRRLYVNADNLGTTLSSKINFYQDYGTSIVLPTTLNLGAFQERIDYGISAKALAFEMITVNTSNSPLKINGFTIESRLQRNV